MEGRRGLGEWFPAVQAEDVVHASRLPVVHKVVAEESSEFFGWCEEQVSGDPVPVALSERDRSVTLVVHFAVPQMLPGSVGDLRLGERKWGGRAEPSCHQGDVKEGMRLAVPLRIVRAFTTHDEVELREAHTVL